MNPPPPRSQRSRVRRSADSKAPVPPAPENSAQQETIQSVLRLIAVLTIFVGVILTTTTLVTLLGMNGALRNAPGRAPVQLSGMLANVGLYAALAHATVALWGIALFFFSPRIARLIAE